MQFSSLRERYRAFREWQQRSYHVPVRNAAVEHDCPTCETHFCGNFCPNCGQPAAMKRYSARSAFLHFLDAWGLGSDIMYRTLRDLLLRPGYLIRDYLNGKRMAYFPPIKLMFLVMAFLYLAGLDDASARREARLRGIPLKELKAGQREELRMRLRDLEQERLQLEMSGTASAGEPAAAAGVAGQNGAPEQSGLEVKKIDIGIKRETARITQWITAAQEQYPNLSRLVFLVLFWLWPLYWQFRRMKTIENFRIAEAFITLLYTFSMRSVLMIPYNLLYIYTSCFATVSPFTAGLLFDGLLQVYPMKQLSGFGWLRTLWKVALSTLLAMLLLLLGVLAALLLLLCF